GRRRPRSSGRALPRQRRRLLSRDGKRETAHQDGGSDRRREDSGRIHQRHWHFLRDSDIGNTGSVLAPDIATSLMSFMCNTVSPFTITSPSTLARPVLPPAKPPRRRRLIGSPTRGTWRTSTLRTSSSMLP